MPRTSWSTQQLTELLASVAELPDRDTLLRRGIEHVAESLGAAAAALVADGDVLCSLGFPSTAVPFAALVAAGSGSEALLDVPGAGACEVLSVDCTAGRAPGSLLVARPPATAWAQEDRVLLRGMAHALALALQARSLVDEERAQREVADRLLTSLQERQTLLERLSRIQRSISSRRPLDEVLDSIVAGAADLLREDIVGLRLVDTDDPAFMVLVSSLGVPGHLADATARQPVGHGIGGRAIVENRLVLTTSYPAIGDPLPGFAADGIQSAMATLAVLTVSVNLSPRQLQEPGLLAEVRDALESSGLPAHALVLEITESLLVRDVDSASRRLDDLKALGVRLAVDDFGTGYSSLSYLSRLPVDILKVDKSFVAGVAEGRSAGKLASAVLALAASLQLRTIAEGVETAEQATALVALGCPMLQGYLYARPVPAGALPGVTQALAAARPVVPEARAAEQVVRL